MNESHPLAIFFAAKGVVARTFAREVGCSESHLSLICKGKRGVSLDLALKIEGATKREVTARQMQDWLSAARAESVG